MCSAKRGAGDDASAGDGPPRPEPSRRTWEATNILTVATAMVAAAATRTESRGCHRRTDHPGPRPEWVRHLDVTLDAAGVIGVTDRPS
jgi:L-aspartate oxidase